jgi:hypothetical protein
LRIILPELHRADLNENLELILTEDITGDRDGNVAIGGLVLEGDLGLNAERKGSPAKSKGDISSHSNHSFDCKTPTSASLSK